VVDVSGRMRMERDLRRAKEAAESASRAKGEFLAMMSHEIRTPMNAILGMTRVMLDMKTYPRIRSGLEMVRSSGETLLVILNDILDFSKLESGRIEFERRAFDLSALFADVTGLMALPAEEKKLSLSTRIASDVPRHLIGDELRLRQILLNLVGNSIKFTERGGVTFQALAEGPGLVRFDVADSGIGIEPKAAARLFSSFSQADSSITRRFGGTGLGLAICKRIVDLQGGRIGFESNPGQGSRFWFVLPLEAGAAPFAAKTEETEAAEGIDVSVLQRLGATFGKEALARRLDLLATDAETCLRLLNQADGGEALRRQALRLGGLCLSFGLSEAAEMADSLAADAEAGDLEAARERLLVLPGHVRQAIGLARQSAA
jgi:nitrogen-specific signal transduction histidine kinase